MAWEAIDSAGWLQFVGVNLRKICCPIDLVEGSLFSMRVFHESPSPETVFQVKPVEWPVGVIHLRTEAVMIGEALTEMVNDANRNLMFSRCFWVPAPDVPIFVYVVAESYIHIQNLDQSAAACGAVHKAINEHEESMSTLAPHGTVLAEPVPDAQWVTDPTGISALRWWDGRSLTDSVSDGTQSWSAPMPTFG